MGESTKPQKTHSHFLLENVKEKYSNLQNQTNTINWQNKSFFLMKSIFYYSERFDFYQKYIFTMITYQLSSQIYTDY